MTDSITYIETDAPVAASPHEITRPVPDGETPEKLANSLRTAFLVALARKKNSYPQGVPEKDLLAMASDYDRIIRRINMLGTSGAKLAALIGYVRGPLITTIREMNCIDAVLSKAVSLLDEEKSSTN